MRQPLAAIRYLENALKWLARIAAGEHLVMLMTEARAGSNTKAKRGLGWHPSMPHGGAASPRVVEVRTP
jgi:hypothetical protein